MSIKPETDAQGMRSLLPARLPMNNAQQAMANREHVRRLLKQKQPRFAGSLELAVSVVQRKLREPANAPQNAGARGAA
jgi:hypothetical protein